MNEKQRAEFEKWASQYEYDLTWSDAIDCYAIMRTRVVFDAWQAALASVVVELPSTYYDQFGDLALDYNATIEGFDKAGVRYE